MIERLGRRPTGDIRNFPRKDVLEEAITTFSTDKFETDKALMAQKQIQGVNKIYIIGSWGRGRAIPFVSDLDAIVVADKIETDESPISMDTSFVVFDEVDIFTSPGVSATEFMLTDINMGTGFLNSKQPHLAYNLTDRRDIKIKNGEIVGL